MNLRRSEKAFTLIELLAVITIIAIIAALVGPVLSHFKKGDAMATATRQLLDDVARARQLAITQRTTVYMIFVGTNFWTSIPAASWNTRLTNLCDKQLTGYAFVSLRSVGDQPGQSLPHYLSQWRKLPDSIYIAQEKFYVPGPVSLTINDLDIAQTFQARPFYRYQVPFPSEDFSFAANWPCIGFNYLGQLVSGEDELIPLAHGSVNYARSAATKQLIFMPVSVDERPENNVRDSYNIIHIDWLTRPRPAGKEGKPVNIPVFKIFRAHAAGRNQAVTGRSAFTMVEIALCLAIIGFALVAIIGVLPMGMNVQKNNREETIINQDAVVWMDAIRNGAKGYDDLTNYVMTITNYWTTYKIVSPTNAIVVTFGADWYTLTNSWLSSSWGYSNGFRIIGLLSMPKKIGVPLPFSRGDIPTVDYQSNYVVAYVRGISGPAAEKFPQKNQSILDNGLTYRMIVENSPYVPVRTESIDLLNTNGMTSAQLNARRATALRVLNLQTNSHDLRLTFRWPVFPNGDTGPNRQTFRLLTGGTIERDFDNIETTQPLYFLQPTIYQQSPPSP